MSSYVCIGMVWWSVVCSDDGLTDWKLALKTHVCTNLLFGVIKMKKEYAIVCGYRGMMNTHLL